MNKKIEIRESSPEDRQELENLYPAAFPEEDLVPLLRALLDRKDDVLSLVAICNEALAGHIIFTICGIDGSTEKVCLLGPIAVAPGRQRQGIGSALIEEGFARMKREGIKQAHVLGDPAYYGRFDFEPDGKVTPPYDLPPEWQTAWQALDLHGGKADLAGKLSVPEPWDHKALWAP